MPVKVDLVIRFSNALVMSVTMVMQLSHPMSTLLLLLVVLILNILEVMLTIRLATSSRYDRVSSSYP